MEHSQWNEEIWSGLKTAQSTLRAIGDQVTAMSLDVSFSKAELVNHTRQKHTVPTSQLLLSNS